MNMFNMKKFSTFKPGLFGLILIGLTLPVLALDLDGSTVKTPKSTSPVEKSVGVVQSEQSGPSCNPTIPQGWPGAENAPSNNWPRPMLGSHKPSPEEKALQAECAHPAPVKTKH